MSSDSDSESDDNGQGQFTFPYKPHRYSSSSVEDSAYQSSSTSLGQRSRSSSSGEDDSEEGGSDQSDSNPGSPVYHSPEEQQWYPYSTGRTFRPSSSTSDDYEMSKNEESPFVGQRHVLEVNQPMDSPSVENSSDEESPPEVKQEPIEERKRFFPPSGEEDDEEEPPKKKMAEYSDFSKRMMSKMGHRPGEGLGRTGEGIVEPIKESVQRGRVGLGAEGVKELLAEEVKWEEEEVSCREHLEWIKPCTMDPPTKDDGLDEWVMMGMRKETIKDETMFCDEQVLEQILKNKSVFDDLDHKAFLDARERSNPFEQIKGVIFQNRAAMKMANIDAVFDFMFTGMKNKNGKKITDTNDVLYFADICSGPGGFSEYVLFRTQWHAKGFGFTLKDPSDASDFKLDEFKASDCETFEPYYGVNGDGDITNTDNMTSLQERVFEATHGAGVHFVMGDGGISVEGEENKQELLTKQLVMCQFACALSILRKGGHFVCKIFDMFTPFLVGLIYLLYRCFDKVCIIKPVTSRPANSERYVVCKGFRNDSRSVADYLFDVNDQLNELKDDEEDESDVLEVVPLEVLQQEEEFMTYVTKSNDRLGKQQCIGLKKIQYFVKNRNLLEERQSDVKEECLRLWHIKNDIRKVRVSLKHMDILDEFWKKLTSSVQVEESTFNPKGLSADNLPPDIYTWKWYYTCGSRYLTVGAGRADCKGWNQRGDVNFSNLINTTHMELPPKTILDVEVCEIFDSNDTKRHVIEVFDAIAIAGTFVGNKPFPERQSLIMKLCEALNGSGRTRMRLKKCHKFAEIGRTLSALEDISNKTFPRVVSFEENGWYTQPRGVVLFKTLKNPWHLQFSKSKNHFYFYNAMEQRSVYETPVGSVASYKDFLLSRFLWFWQPNQIRSVLGLVEGKNSLSEGILTKHQVAEYVARRMNT